MLSYVEKFENVQKFSTLSAHDCEWHLVANKHNKRDLYNTCIVSQLSRNKYCLNQTQPVSNFFPMHTTKQQSFAYTTINCCYTALCDRAVRRFKGNLISCLIFLPRQCYLYYYTDVTCGIVKITMQWILYFLKFASIF